MENFDKIIGSGGFGLIVKHKDEDVVAKMLYGGGCDASEIEFRKHERIYQAFQKVKTYLPPHTLYNQICISKPLGFDRDSVVKFGQSFDCFYLMTLLKNLDQELARSAGLYHVIDDGYKAYVDKVVGRRFSEPISTQNPSRGFFASYSYIAEHILPNLSPEEKGGMTTIKDIIECMGFAVGIIIFLAGYIPADVEYTLGLSDSELCLAVLDFGMVTEITFNPDAVLEGQKEKKLNLIAQTLVSTLEVDIYLPQDDALKSIFLEGMKDAVDTSIAINPQNALEKRYVFERFKTSFA